MRERYHGKRRGSVPKPEIAVAVVRSNRAESMGLPTRFSSRAVVLFTLSFYFLTGCGPANESASRDRQRANEIKKVAVAASANLQFAFEPIERAFEEKHPELDLVVTYGASGNFYSQLSQRAPYDIFFSADTVYPKRLQREGFAPADGYFAYAKGRLVIWVVNDSPLDLESLGAGALVDPSIRKIAIANPTLAPYGAAAESAMRHLGVYESVQDRLVFGENVSQVGHFVFSGAADAGVIALALALAPAMQEKGRYWEIPADAYESIDQAGVVLSSSKHPDAAERLRIFVTSEQGQHLLKQYGYTPMNE